MRRERVRPGGRRAEAKRHPDLAGTRPAKRGRDVQRQTLRVQTDPSGLAATDFSRREGAGWANRPAKARHGVDVTYVSVDVLRR